jgi:succinate CoA transferase
MSTSYPLLSPAEAAALINNGDTVATSGFTFAGSPKVVTRALAERAKAAHQRGEPFKVRLFTGASTGPSCDGVLAEADAVSWRAPYQSDPILRGKINSGEIPFLDMHLSHFPQYVEYGFLGEIDVAIIEATSVTPEGHVYLSTAGGCAPTWMKLAKKIIIELNRFHHPRLREMHDDVEVPRPPLRRALRINHPLDKIGTPFFFADKSRIVGIVETNLPDEGNEFKPHDEESARIGEFVVDFLVSEQRAGRIPPELLPLQAGVGNVANAAMASLGADQRIPPFMFYTEVFQDSMADLINAGRCVGVSTCSLTVSPRKLRDMYDDMDTFIPKIVIRPQMISNNPEVIRRLGVIAMNTALEVDIYGHVNSTNVCGTKMMNGIGGSGDFTRNAYISIYMTPSTARKGAISAIVPFASHVDHNEHSVQVVVTEQGIADLRGKTATERSRAIIDNCAHPDYRPLLNDYLRNAGKGNMPHDLRHAFDFHVRFLETGSMMPK